MRCERDTIHREILPAIVVACILSLGATPTHAATIDIETIDNDGRSITIISIEDELQAGDERRFADAAIRGDEAIVFLNSPGGNLLAGIEIGKAIRLKGFVTVVTEGFSCASACAFAWLGGRVRFMAAGSTIGFHAAYKKDDPGQTADSVANALVGAYLNQLGLPLSAIAYITEAQPGDIRWLTFEDADRHGIEVRRLPPQDQKPSIAGPTNQPEGPSDGSGSTQDEN